MHRSNYRSFTNRATGPQLKKLSELYLSSAFSQAERDELRDWMCSRPTFADARAALWPE